MNFLKWKRIGLVLCVVLTVALTTLKVLGYVDLDWLLVLSPLWIAGIVASTFLSASIIGVWFKSQKRD